MFKLLFCAFCLVSAFARNPYKILDVNPKSSEKEIKQKFRELSKKYHPDKYKSGDDKFKDINWAYEVLSDPKLREAYDNGGEEGVKFAQSGQTPARPQYQNPGFQFFNFGGPQFARGSAGPSHSTFFFNFGAEDEANAGLDDILKTFFGATNHRNDPNSRRRNQYYNPYNVSNTYETRPPKPTNPQTIRRMIEKHFTFKHITTGQLDVNLMKDTDFVIVFVYSSDTQDVLDNAQLFDEIISNSPFKETAQFLDCTKSSPQCSKFIYSSKYSIQGTVFAVNTSDKNLGKLISLGSNITPAILTKFLDISYFPTIITKAGNLIAHFKSVTQPVVLIYRSKKLSEADQYNMLQDIRPLKNSINFVDISNMTGKIAGESGKFVNVILKRIKFDEDNNKFALIHVVDIFDIDNAEIEHLTGNGLVQKLHYTLRKWINDFNNLIGIYSYPRRLDSRLLTPKICGTNDAKICIIFVQYSSKIDSQKASEIFDSVIDEKLSMTRLFYTSCSQNSTICRRAQYQEDFFIVQRGRQVNSHIVLPMKDKAQIREILNNPKILTQIGIQGLLV